LHPDARRRQRRRRRWLWIALAACVSALTYVWLTSAHQVALRATDDADPAVGALLTAAICFVLSLCLVVMLLVVAVAAEVRERTYRRQ
jgi:hypothetical protein